MKAKILLFLQLVFAFSTRGLFAQNLPVWVYTAPSLYSYQSSDINLQNGYLFVQFGVTETFPCSSHHGSSILLDNSGNQTWENVFDTTNGCQMEFARGCKVITAPSVGYYVASPYYDSSPDSVYTVIYNNAGQNIASNYSGYNFHYLANMNDGYCYQGNDNYMIYKTDSLGSLIWQYTLPDSNDLYSLYANVYRQRLLITTVDYTQSSTDKKINFFGLDTAGFMHFNSSINLVLNSNETVKSIWFTNSRNILGVLYVPSSTLRFFSLDTAANLNYPVIDLQALNYVNPVYDSIHNLLHYLKPTVSGAAKMYSLDCSTGIIQDSIFLDTVGINSRLAIDQHGNVLLMSHYLSSSVNSFYVKRFTYNYYLDWTGLIASPPTNSNLLYDIKTDTSNNIYLFYRYNSLAHIAKFSPPLVSGINEPNPYKNQLQLVPNPTSSEVTIRRKETSDLPSTLLIRDVSGKLIQQLNIPAHQTSYTFSTNDIPSGVYFVAWGTGVASKLIVIH